MRVALTVAATMCLMACSRGGDGAEPGPDRPASDQPTARAATRPGPTKKAPAQRVHLTAASGEEVAVQVEVVNTRRARSRGLMYRQHLPPDNGMLFIFDATKLQSFWMKNTLIPLDMLFIDEAMNVVGIVENTEPMTNTPRVVDTPSIYVLEVNAGWSRAHGVATGAKVRFENVGR